MRGLVSEPEVLHGGVANAGAVVRVGDTVFRPTNPHSDTIHRFLLHVAERADIAPQPTAPPTHESEQLRFIPGDVPIPPYADWAQTDEALAGTVALIRSLHEVSRSFQGRAHDAWSAEMADPTDGGLVICHNDVCLENVVFRNGVAVALLDFDFAAPGRPTHDLACFARMCVPIDDDISRRNLGWLDGDLPRRLRLVADVYGLDLDQRREVVASLDRSIRHGGEFVRRHAEAGEPGFVAMWQEIGGMAGFDRRRDWWAQQRDTFVSVME